ncbi:MAG TPA: glutaredoxin domain-containing protein [Ktedonobacterales bacterium]
MTETDPAAIVMYTTSWCGDCRRAKRVFADLGVPYIEINIEETPLAAEVVRRFNDGMQSVPTIVFPDGALLTEPSNQALAAQLQRYMASGR